MGDAPIAAATDNGATGPLKTADGAAPEGWSKTMYSRRATTNPHGSPRLLAAALVAAAASALATPAGAAVTTFFGEDLGPGDESRPASMPNAQSAHDGFLSNLVGVTTEGFEGFVDGATGPFALAFGGDTATLSNGAGATVRDVPSGTFNGTFPTTGAKFLLTNIGGGAFSITFSAPQNAFGFYATDIGDGGGRLGLAFDDAALDVPSSALTPSGSVLFFGYINPDVAFTKVTFTNASQGVDGFGFDDLTVGRHENILAPVPEPDSWALLILGFAGLGAALRRRRHVFA
jgi:hypothetical protein